MSEISILLPLYSQGVFKENLLEQVPPPHLHFHSLESDIPWNHSPETVSEELNHATRVHALCTFSILYYSEPLGICNMA